MHTSSIIPCKKDNLSVYNIREVCFASLLRFLKNKEHFQQGDQIRQKKEFDGAPSVSQSLSVNAISRHEKKNNTETEPILRLGKHSRPSNDEIFKTIRVFGCPAHHRYIMAHGSFRRPFLQTPWIRHYLSILIIFQIRFLE